MTARSYRLPTAGLAGALLAVLGLAACEQASSPRQVQASNPTVTYKYSSDRDLVEANQRAASFCSQYGATPRTVSLGSDGSGDRIAMYECVQAGAATTVMPPVYSSAALAPPTGSNLTYTYRTDRELLEASRQAQAYCANRGSSQVTSNMIVNANGSRTVTFQCAG